ncbi:hypothetical protein IJL65_00745 [bacterium]|nr:hypothetical protein [bacterium]
MKRKEVSMMLSVNEDSLDDSDDDSEVLILEISDDLVDSEIEKALILILEICLDEYFDDDLVDDERRCVNERI